MYKRQQLDRELNYLPLHRQVDIINNIIANIQQKKILPKSPNSLGFLPDSLDIMIDNIGNKDKMCIRDRPCSISCCKACFL